MHGFTNIKFMIISGLILFTMRNVVDKRYRKNRNIHFTFDKSFLPSNRAGNAENMIETDRPQMKIWRMRIACWMPKAINAPSEYIILIVFPLQQWLNECASMLRLYVQFLSTPSEYVILIAFPLQQWLHESALMLRLYVQFLYTLSEYVILIAFPLQQWLHESALMLRFYVHFLSTL
jgi:hypothetical protein